MVFRPEGGRVDVGRLGRVFLEKKLGLHGRGAYFSKTSLGCTGPGRIPREKAWAAELGRVFLENWVIRLPENPQKVAQHFSHNFRLELLFKSCHFEQLVVEGILRPLGGAFLEKKLGLHGWGAYFSRKSVVWMAGARISREKKLGLDGWGAYV